MQLGQIPTFVIVGHPNEGKSSVVSTLTENDSVPISTTPGETAEAIAYPVVLDGIEVIRFIDTPGFQSPMRAMAWIKMNQSSGNKKFLIDFIEAHKADEQFYAESVILSSLMEAMSIIFVVDGSHRITEYDRAEMEILRMTGLPRMAVINLKDDNDEFLEAWKKEFNMNFNTYRIFNAQRATFVERIDLLETIKNIAPDNQQSIELVISTFKNDWETRISKTATTILKLLEDSLSYITITQSGNKKTKAELEDIKKRLYEDYIKSLSKMESDAHKKIKTYFKHNIFQYYFSTQSTLQNDLFSEETWRILGIKRWNLVMGSAALQGTTGATIGALIETGFGGLTAGAHIAIGALIGTTTGAISGYFGTKKLSSAKVMLYQFEKIEIKIGPNQNAQFPFILLDRAFLYFSNVINWAHSRRDNNLATRETLENIKIGVSVNFDDKKRNTVFKYAKFVIKKNEKKLTEAREGMLKLIMDELTIISSSNKQ